MIVGKNYCISAENLGAHELIGLNVKIAECGDFSKKGLSGKIVFESRETFSIETIKGKKIVAKKECVFSFDLGNESVELDGKQLVSRPEDRVKNFFKKFYQKTRASPQKIFLKNLAE